MEIHFSEACDGCGKLGAAVAIPALSERVNYEVLFCSECLLAMRDYLVKEE